MGPAGGAVSPARAPLSAPESKTRRERSACAGMANEYADQCCDDGRSGARDSGIPHKAQPNRGWRWMRGGAFRDHLCSHCFTWTIKPSQRYQFGLARRTSAASDVGSELDHRDVAGGGDAKNQADQHAKGTRVEEGVDEDAKRERDDHRGRDRYAHSGELGARKLRGRGGAAQSASPWWWTCFGRTLRPSTCTSPSSIATKGRRGTRRRLCQIRTTRATTSRPSAMSMIRRWP